MGHCWKSHERSVCRQNRYFRPGTGNAGQCSIWMPRLF
nr:MAG TPA: hypothetical protein [Caudoviricetes sp.]